MSKVQNQRVLDHMIDHGYITPLIAQSYGIQRLASRINDLKRAGALIANTIMTSDAGVRYSHYTLTHRGSEALRRSRGSGWSFGSLAA
jgi:Helix-turn-helix domain